MKMSQNWSKSDKNKLLQIICELHEIKSMKVCINTSLKSGILVGSCAALGGLLGGPRGLAFGGIASSLVALCANDGSFKSVPYIIMNEATEKQKEDLTNSLLELCTLENIYNMAMLCTALSSSSQFINYVLKLVGTWLKNEMNYEDYTYN